MSALIGALRVSLSADTAQFEAGMKRARATANTAASGITKTMGVLKAGVAGLVAGLSVGMFVNVIKGALDYAGSLAEVASQVGVTARELQTLRFAAAQNGVSTEQLETALTKLSVGMGKANAGSKQVQAAFKAVGVELGDLQTKSKSEILGQIADSMLKTGGAAKNAAAGVAIMGKGFMAMAPLLDQGSAGINGLADAAEKLGIVLSDEQIRKADDTADKLEALKTVLSANIAGVVADNADAILVLANALAKIVTTAVAAGRALANFYSFAGQVSSQAAQQHPGIAGAVVGGVSALNPAVGMLLGKVLGGGGGKAKAAPKLPPAPSAPGTGDIDKFLAGGGGGKPKKAAADHSAEDALRDQFQFNQELGRAHVDILRAQQDLAKDYVERTNIGVQILNAEKDAYAAELAYQVSLHKLSEGKQGLTQVQADQLQAEYDIKDSLEREKLLQDEQEQRQRDVQELSQHDFDRRREVLQAQEQIASTAAERRKIELELLELAYEQKRQALQHIVDTDKDEKAKEDARRDLVNLSQTHEADKQGVLNATRGPLEDWAASVPKTAAQINEALQSIEAQGLDSLINSIDVADASWAKFGESFKAIGLDMLTMLVRLGAKMLIVRALSGIFGGGAFSGTGADAAVDSGIYGNIGSVGLPGFAGGGSFNILGRKGTDKNVLSVNGVRIANVSHGERINIANDGVNGGGGPAVIVHQNNNFAGGAVTQTDLLRMHQVTVAASTKAINEQRRRG